MFRRTECAIRRNGVDSLINVKNVSKSYGKTIILRDVSFSIGKGESVVFTGHNGTGKSTLLKMAANLIKPTSGKIAYEKKLKFTYIPENFPKMSLTARQYLYCMGKIDGLGEKELLKRSDHLFEEFFITSMVDIPMKHLSKGTLQKVGVIQALLATSDVILLDEPLSGQDAQSQAVFIEKMNQLRQQGVALMMSCHEKYLIGRISDTVYQIHNRQLQQIQKSSFRQMYRLIFESGKDAVMPKELSEVIKKTGERYQLTVPEQSTNKVILDMLQHGWTLKEMEYENTL
jgi:ABC-type multidrug transport system ATPase subunit